MEPKHRILFCTLGYEPGPVGGAERQAMRQAEALVERGYQVDVVCPRSRGVRSGCIDGVTVRRLPRVDRSPFRTITYLPVLAMWLLSHLQRYDLVHVHLANLQADVVGIISKISKTPMYVKLAAGGPRGEIGRMRRVAWLTRFVGIRSAARVQALSGEIEADLLDIGVAQRRIVRIPNGLTPAMTGPALGDERRQLRRELELPEAGVLVLYAGRFATYKGVLDLIGAWNNVDRPTATLVLVGEPAVDAPIGTLPQASQMTVRGWTPRVTDYMRACDIYVLPSYAEGMSNALLEAMACGMASIATRVGAAPEMIDDGVSGLLVEPGDRAGLLAAMEKLIDDENIRATFAQNATRTTADRYGIAPVVDRIAATYEQILTEFRS